MLVLFSIDMVKNRCLNMFMRKASFRKSQVDWFDGSASQCHDPRSCGL